MLLSFVVWLLYVMCVGVCCRDLLCVVICIVLVYVGVWFMAWLSLFRRVVAC